MSKAIMNTTMWADHKPNCYGGESCDQIVPQWELHVVDERGGDVEKSVTLDAKHFPPGTRITIEEPLCPECKSPREISRVENDTHVYEDECNCGFDWQSWTLSQFS